MAEESSAEKARILKELEQVKKVAFVDAESMLEARSREMAEDTLDQQKKNLKWYQFKKRIWDHNWHREYKRQKEIIKAREQIQQSGNLYVDEAPHEQRHHEEAMQALIDKFTSDYDDVVRKGEKKEVSTDDRLKAITKQLVYDYANKHITDRSAFEAERQKRFKAEQDYRKQNKMDLLPEQVIKAGVGYTNNLFKVAELVRSAVDHGISLDKLDLQFDVVIAQARDAVKVEANLNNFDRIIDKVKRFQIKGVPIGTWVNETTITLGLASVYSLTIGATQRLARSKAASWATLGGTAVVGGAIAAAQENVRMKQERAKIERKLAHNKPAAPTATGQPTSRLGKFAARAKRTAVGKFFTQPEDAEFAAVSYEKKKAGDLLSKFDEYALIQTPEGKLDLNKGISQEQFEEILDHMAGIEARFNLEAQRGIALVKYDKTTGSNRQNVNLDIARATTKAKLRQWLATPDCTLSLPAGKNFDQHYSELVDKKAKELTEGDITAKDKAFRKLKARSVAMHFVRTAAVAVALGTTVQQLRAWGGDVVSWMQGRDNVRNATVLEHMLGGKGQAQTMAEMGGALSNGEHMSVVESNGRMNLVDAQGRTVLEDLRANPDGTFDQATLDKLQQQGYMVFDDPAKMEQVTKTMSAQEYWQDKLTENKRIDWHDEPGPRYSNFYHKLIEFEGKQQMLYLKRDGNGVYVDARLVIDNIAKNAEKAFREFGRNPDGSFDSKLKHMHDEIVNWHKSGELAQHFQVAIIPTEEANKKGLSFLLQGADAQGRIYLTPEQSAMFTNDKMLRDGNLPFKYMEERLDGHTLSTVRGQAPESITTTINVHHPEIFGPSPEGVPPGVLPRDYDVPWAIPVDWRGKPRQAEQPLPPDVLPTDEGSLADIYDYYGSGGLDKATLAAMRRNRSESLEDNPNARLNHYYEAEEYLERQNPEYLEQVKVLAGHMGVMNKDCKLSVCIPAAGHQEGENIYRTLESYLYQTAHKDDFEVVVFVNHPDQDRSGNKVVPDKTLEEVRRFQTEHPELNVRVAYQTLPIERAKIGYVRKLLNDAVLYRHHQRGENAPDLIHVSNDADNTGLAKEYIQNFIDKFEDNPNVEGMLGQLDWDPEAYTQHPVIHIGTRLYQFLKVPHRRQGGGFASSGANFAFRSSIYAGIGGYPPDAAGGEDVAIGAGIVAARKGRQTLGYAGNRVSRVYTSARRAIHEWEKHGLQPSVQWARGFSAFDDSVRKLRLEGKTIDYDNPQILDGLQKSLQEMINKTVDRHERRKTLGKGDPRYKKFVELLGIRYELNAKGDIVITDMSALVKRLKEYQRYGVALRDFKSGKPGAQEELQRIRGTASAETEQDRAERKEQKSKRLERRLKKFYEDNALGISLSNPLISTSRIERSAQKFNIGNYVAAKDVILSDVETGKVFPAIDQRTNQVVIIKQAPKSVMQESATNYGARDGVLDTESFLMQKSFSHPNVLLPTEKFEVGDNVCRVYEPGVQDLSRYLSKNKDLSLQQALSIMIQVSDGARAMHEEGAAHSDIAPLNIILFKDGVKLGDLDGGSVDKDGTGRYGREIMRGNRFIMPPEMFRTPPRFDATVDSYQAAATLYRIITGEWPYKDEAAEKITDYQERMDRYAQLHQAGNIKFPASVPAELQTVIKKAMSPSTRKRYGTMEEFESALLDVYDKMYGKPETKETDKSNLPEMMKIIGRLQREQALSVDKDENESRAKAIRSAFRRSEFIKAEKLLNEVLDETTDKTNTRVLKKLVQQVEAIKG